jgi:uncharacterized tellurite resistance protein B-like protein
MEQETHLLKNFSENEKAAYLGAIASLAASDGTTTPEETAFLQALAERSDLSEQGQQAVMAASQDASKVSLQKCLDVLKGSDLKFSFVTDIISFAQADGAFSAEEQEQVKKIATYLGISEQQYQALTQFVGAAKQVQVTEQDLQQPEGFLEKLGVGNAMKSSGIPMDSIMKGAIGILGPLVLSRVLGGAMGGRGGMGGMMGGGGGLGGILGGGGGMGGGLGSILGGVLGGMGSGGGMGGYGRQGGGMMSGGGLGSLISILGGLGNRGGYQQRGGMGGLLGGLGGLFGGKGGGGLF